MYEIVSQINFNLLNLVAIFLEKCLPLSDDDVTKMIK